MTVAVLSRLVALLVVIDLCQAPLANATETPPELPGASIASAEEVARMLASGVPVVDTRVGNEFAEAHIRGAINIPYKERSPKTPQFDASQDSFDLSKLPANKAAPIVFYCNAGDCWKSFKASTLAVRSGYRKVYWFRGGFPEWKKKGLPVD